MTAVVVLVLAVFVGLPLYMVLRASFAARHGLVEQLRALASTLEDAAVESKRSLLFPNVRMFGTWRERRVGARISLGIAFALRVESNKGEHRLPGRLLARLIEDWAGAAPPRAQTAEAMRSAYRQLFDEVGVSALTLKGGWLRVSRERSAAALDAAEETWSALLALAPLFEARRAEVEVTLQLAAGACVLCPYCKDDAVPGSPDATACEACGTVHHRACLEEAGGCTVLGCSERPRRERA